MQKLYYGMGLTGLSLLILLAFVWTVQQGSRPLARPTEHTPEEPSPPMALAAVVQPDTAVRTAVQPADLQAVKNELATLQRQQSAALAALRQQQTVALEALQQRLERLLAAQRALTRQLDGLVPLVASDEDTSQTLDNAEDINVEQVIDQVAQTHEAQAVDPAWSTQAATAIAQSFSTYSQRLPGAVLLNAECRTTICRLEVGVEDEAAQEEVATLLPHVIPWSTHALIDFDAESKTVIFYASREGVTFDEAVR
jgi:hypothetical protein